jgi:hypothetical protein
LNGLAFLVDRDMSHGDLFAAEYIEMFSYRVQSEHEFTLLRVELFFVLVEKVECFSITPDCLHPFISSHKGLSKDIPVCPGICGYLLAHTGISNDKSLTLIILDTDWKLQRIEESPFRATSLGTIRVL